jgi:hypothetical protein
MSYLCHTGQISYHIIRAQFYAWKTEYRFPKCIYLHDISPIFSFFGDISPKWRYIVRIYLQNGDIIRYIFIFRRYISISQKIYITKMQIYLDISSFFRGFISPFLEIYLLFWRYISFYAQRYILYHEKWAFFRKDISPKFRI